jgi:hypothetical protein
MRFHVVRVPLRIGDDHGTCVHSAVGSFNHFLSLLDFMVDVSARSSSEVGEALHEVEGESVSGR